MASPAASTPMMSAPGAVGCSFGSAGILDAIGNTPLVDITALLDGMEIAAGVRLLAKLEGANPSGSVKDRVAKAMILDARERGVLARGQTILEPTSGNTGISLAMIGAVLGHPVKAVMPDNVTAERVELLKLYGAEVIASPGSLGSNGSVRMAQELAAADPSLFMPMQYENPANPAAHYDGTALEIIEQTGGKVDAFVAGLGTGGTLMGCGRRLREHNADVQIVAAEPMPGDPIMGLRSLDDGYIPPIIDASVFDRKLIVSNAASIKSLRALASQAGIFAGVSAGAALHVAGRIAREADAGATIVMLIADSGWKYVSAGLWTRDLDELDDAMEAGHWW